MTIKYLSYSALQTLVAKITGRIDAVEDKIFLSAHPVGEIYLSTDSRNPGTLYGGTWEAWGSGRVPIGVNASDTDFATVEKTGGAKSVNLAHSHTVNSHNHTISHTHTVNSHTHSTGNHTLTVDEMPSHGHPFPYNLMGWPTSGTSWSFGTWDQNKYPYIRECGGTNSVGGGKAHNHGNTGSASPATGGGVSLKQWLCFARNEFTAFVLSKYRAAVHHLLYVEAGGVSRKGVRYA